MCIDSHESDYYLIDNFKHSVARLGMRFFVKIKEQGRQVAIKRVECKTEITKTGELIALIEKSIHLQSTKFIVRIINDQTRLRLVQGWPLSLYAIKSGLQLEVELLSGLKKPVLDSESNGDMGELLFNKQQMQKIVQENEEDGQEVSEISQLVQTKYEQLLKMIQKGDTAGYLREVKSSSPELGSCENEVYCRELLAIQNELGTKGWGAMHYAVFTGNVEIVNFLIQLGVDVNNKTSDEWLPIQLAIKQQNYGMIDLLVAQPFLNINICTSQGLPINLAVQSSNRKIIQQILMKDVNFSLRDHKYRSVYDMLGQNPNKEILDLIVKSEQRQSITNTIGEKKAMYHALISSFKGDVICVRTPPRKNKDYYLCINPYETAVKIYEEKAHYPQFPKQVLPIAQVVKFQELAKSERSWYMKSDLFYFHVCTNKSKYIFGCCFENTVRRWVSAFQQSFRYVKMYPDSIKQFKRNEDVTIMDRIQMEVTKSNRKPSNKKEDLMSLFMSKSSDRTEESPDKNRNFVLAKQVEKSPSKPNRKNSEIPKLQPPLANNIALITNNGSESSQSSKTGFKFADFKIIKILGEGSFGTVLLALDLRNPEKKKQYALKCFKKKKLVVNKQIKYTIAELNILKQLSHPFIVNLHFTFQTPNYVYLGLDYCPNKDLSHHLMNEVTFPQKQSMVYAAEILLALEYLHSKNIIYRDLKPENIMLDEKGHVRLVDFGLSKQGQEKEREFVAKSFCGSPAYLSPQMLIKKGVGKESDFYCLGAVLYEMMVGEPPFFSDDIVTLYNNISNSKLTFPKSLSSEAKSLLLGLLERNPQSRLGYKGAGEIKQHPFFKEIDWGGLLKKQIKAPVRQEVEVEHGREQEQEEPFAIQNIHKDFDYSAQNYRINRFLNFTFVREDSSQL